MKGFFKSKLGMFAVFAVVLAMALLATLLMRRPLTTPQARGGQTPSQPTEAQTTAKPAAPAGKAAATTAEGTGAPAPQGQPSEAPVQRFQRNVPVSTYTVQAEAPESQMPLAAEKVIERQYSRMEMPNSQGGQGNQNQNQGKAQQPGPPTMASFSRRHTDRDRSPAATTASSDQRPTAPTPAATEISSSPISARFLPFGRAIKAELVNALVSSTRRGAPIVALVTEDVRDWSTDEVIIPAGSELHGVAAPDKQLQRMFSEDHWILVLPKHDKRAPGAEIRIVGTALDRDERLLDNGAATFSQYDMAPGIPAEIVRSDDEVKLFLGEALKGFASVSQTRDSYSSPYGTTETVQSTTRNALLGAGGSVADKYAELALEEYKNNGWFLRVRASKQFYLYVQQTVDMEQARIGYTTINSEKGPTKSSAPQPSNSIQ